jgi:hypothetical protein
MNVRIYRELFTWLENGEESSKLNLNNKDIWGGLGKRGWATPRIQVTPILGDLCYLEESVMRYKKNGWLNLRWVEIIDWIWHLLRCNDDSENENGGNS